MNTIYSYNNEFDRSHVIDKVNEIAEEIEEEIEKPEDERDGNKEFKLIYKQFIEGLKLSTRNNLL